MAVDFEGVIYDSVIFNPGNPAFGSGEQIPPPPTTLVPVMRPDVGPSDNVRNAPFSPRIIGSAFVGDTSAWFMDQYWIDPNPVNFGNITSDKVVDIAILNTFRDGAHTFLSIDFALLPGVTVTANPPPFVLPLMGQDNISVTASLEGDPEFDDDAIFEFDNRNIAIRMLGQRVILFSFVPEKPISEQLTFRTDIMRSRDETEQRHALRTVPRQFVTLNYKPRTPQEAASLRNVLKTQQPFLFGVPEWWDERPILNPSELDLPIGTTVIPCDPDNAMFFADRSAVIILADDTVQDVTLLSVQAGVSVTLDQPTFFPIPKGSAIIPLATGYLSGSPKLSDYMVNLEQTELKFEFFSTEDIAFTDAEFAADPFFEKHPLDGFLVMTDPNVMRGATFSHELIQERTRNDSGVGELDVHPVDDLGIPQFPKGVILHKRFDIWEWKKLIHYLRGSWKPFYLPTFLNDLPVVAPGYDLSSTSILIEFVGKTGAGFGPPFGDVLIEVLDDGRQFVRRITAMVDNGNDTETVSLNASATGSPEIIPPDNIRVSYAMLGRIEGDVVTFTHEYLGEATIRMKFKGTVS